MSPLLLKSPIGSAATYVQVGLLAALLLLGTHFGHSQTGETDSTPETEPVESTADPGNEEKGAKPEPPAVVDPRAQTLADTALRLVPGDRPFRDRLSEVVVHVYEGSGFRPIWNGDDLPGDVHLELSKALSAHAFPPLFALDPMELQVEIQASSPPVDARDLAFTIALLDAGLLCRVGAVDPQQIWPEWNRDDVPGSEDHSVEKIARDLLLATAVRPFDPAEVLDRLASRNWIYRALQQEFPAYQQAVLRYSGLPPIPDPASAGIANPNAPCSYAPAIAAHLADRGYFTEPPEGFSSLTTLTPELSASLMNFQRDQGLEADGVFGRESWRFLNTNAADRYRSLSINLHRSRILPKDLGKRYALVNLPCAELYLFEKGDFHVETMRIVHGNASSESQHTPVFRDLMQEVVFGPYWNVPPGIAKKEILPRAEADWGYLSRNRYEIVRDFNPYNKQALRLSHENLRLVSEGRLFLRQKPGPDNALGHVKFLFPNSFSVYMHDTPSKNFFRMSNRDLSHGCIRVSNPKRLGEWVLGQAGWSSEEVEAAILAETRRSVAIQDPIPVYILYLTTFPRPVGAGKIVLAPGRDVYERDPADSAVLSAAIPWKQAAASTRSGTGTP